MNMLIQELIGAGFGGALTLLIVFITISFGRIGKTPKRLDRVEALQPLFLEVIQAFSILMAVNVKALRIQAVNGDLEKAETVVNAAMKKLTSYLNEASMSQKAKK